MLRQSRLFLFAWLAMLPMFMAAFGQAHAAYEERFKLAEQYLTLFGEGKYEEAHGLLATDEPFEAFLKRIELVNRHFVDELSGRGLNPTGRKVARVTPLLFEDTYIIVNVATVITAEDDGRPIEEILNSGVYFRFNENNQIEMVHAIGEGWLC